ncbi:hypothetical protein ACSBR2_016860 [Camellia fascicularis]
MLTSARVWKHVLRGVVDVHWVVPLVQSMDDVLLLLLCTYRQTNVVVRLHHAITFAQLVDDICGKFNDLVRDVVYMLWDVPGYKKFKVDSDDDIRNMLCLAKSFGLNHFDVLIKIRDVPVGGNYGGAYCNEGQKSKFGNRTFGMDDQTDLLPTYCLNKSKTFLSTQWVFGITYVGQCFVGGANEFQEILCTYAVECGFQFKYVKNDSVRITAVCKFVESTAGTWSVHERVLPSNGILCVKKLDSVHNCGAAV